jgi:HSP20 family protein
MVRPALMNVAEFERDNGAAIDLVERPNESIVVVELPGVAKEDVKISLEGELLTIKGERKTSGLPDGARWIRSERSSGEFFRTIQLPHPVKADAVSAEMVNGVLRITLPKAEEARPREIGIK